MCSLVRLTVNWHFTDSVELRTCGGGKNKKSTFNWLKIELYLSLWAQSYKYLVYYSSYMYFSSFFLCIVLSFAFYSSLLSYFSSILWFTSFNLSSLRLIRHSTFEGRTPHTVPESLLSMIARLPAVNKCTCMRTVISIFLEIQIIWVFGESENFIKW